MSDGIKRFADYHNALTEDGDGDYMLVADHIAIMTHEAPKNSLEALAEETLDRIAEFFGQCVNDPGFAGFSVDEVKDRDGRLLSLTLVPVDTVAGDPVRRVGR